MVSVYRRPRPVANLRYVTHQGFGVFAFIGKNGLPASRDPETGKPSAMNLLSDARQPTLKTQAVEAAVTHLQFDGKLDDERLRRIADFERQLYAAQIRDYRRRRSHGSRTDRRASACATSPRAVRGC